MIIVSVTVASTRMATEIYTPRSLPPMIMTMMVMKIKMVKIMLRESTYPVLCLARRGVKMVITAVAVIPQRKTLFPPYLRQQYVYMFQYLGAQHPTK